MRILVTGGAGFLGSHLCDKLISHGHEITVIDNFYTGSKSNLNHLKNNKKIQIVRHDVTNPYSIKTDAIYNLACPASPIHYQRNPVQTIRTSILGSINALELAKKLEIPILQSSTSEVYGDPNVSPQNETYWGNVNPIGIRACYDEGKRASETLFFDYHRQFNVNIKVARIFNTYGPRMSLNDGRVVSNFIMQALKNEDITLYGDGNQTRSFCFVDDLIDGLIKFMESDRAETGPINLGNPVEISMIELAQKILEITKSKSAITFSDLPQDDPKQRKPDIQKANSLLNWSPKINLGVGLEKTIEDFSTRIKI